MKLISTEPKNNAINIRCNDAERAMVDAVRGITKPTVSASKLLLYLCEEKAREAGLIHDNKNGTWYIEV